MKKIKLFLTSLLLIILSNSSQSIELKLDIKDREITFEECIEVFEKGKILGTIDSYNENENLKEHYLTILHNRFVYSGMSSSHFGLECFYKQKVIKE